MIRPELAAFINQRLLENEGLPEEEQIGLVVIELIDQHDAIDEAEALRWIGLCRPQSAPQNLEGPDEGMGDVPQIPLSSTSSTSPSSYTPQEDTVMTNAGANEGPSRVVPAEPTQPTQPPSPLPSLPPPPHSWYVFRYFGGEPGIQNLDPEEIVSTCHFNNTGEFLGVGDNSGRIMLFKGERSDQPIRHTDVVPGITYSFVFEHSGHEQEYDVLQSKEIPPRVVDLQFLPYSHSGPFFLSSSEREVKLWKVRPRELQAPLHNNDVDEEDEGDEGEQALIPKLKNVYSAHFDSIHSISPSSDSQSFLSADSKRVHQWDINVTNQTFNVLDLRRDVFHSTDMPEEFVDEMITVARFHPTSPTEFALGTDFGRVGLFDTRTALHCPASLVFEDPPETETFFTNFIVPITDIKFHPNGRLILTRDLMTLKLWDCAMSHEPVRTFRVHEHLRQYFGTMFENGCFEDKFECCFSPSGDKVVTGSYDNKFYCWDVDSDEGGQSSFEAALPKRKKKKRRKDANTGESRPPTPEPMDVGPQWNKKGLVVDWSHGKNVLAACTPANVFLLASRTPETGS